MENDEVYVTDGPPGSGWSWSGGENDGKIHGPLRLAEIRVENNGQNDCFDLTLVKLDIQASCSPQKQCIVTTEWTDKNNFCATLQSMSKDPLQGILSWTLKTWDGDIVGENHQNIITPSPRRTQTNLYSVTLSAGRNKVY